MDSLTPMDIFNKDFKYSIRGYNAKEVNEFLDLVIKNYENVLQENEYLKEQNQALKQQHQSEKSYVKNANWKYDEIINEILSRLDRVEQVVSR